MNSVFLKKLPCLCTSSGIFGQGEGGEKTRSKGILCWYMGVFQLKSIEFEFINWVIDPHAITGSFSCDICRAIISCIYWWERQCSKNLCYVACFYWDLRESCLEVRDGVKHSNEPKCCLTLVPEICPVLPYLAVLFLLWGQDANPWSQNRHWTAVWKNQNFSYLDCHLTLGK